MPDEPAGTEIRTNTEPRYTVKQRFLVALLSFGLVLVVTPFAAFGLREALRETIPGTPLDPSGYKVVDISTGLALRDATTWDMIKVKYWVLLPIAVYLALVGFNVYIIALAIRGKPSRILDWAVGELSKSHFKLER